MKPPVAGAHTFVLRVWLEEVDASGRARWAGHMTHVLDERREYVNSLQAINDFIKGYLRTMGVCDDNGAGSVGESPT